MTDLATTDTSTEAPADTGVEPSLATSGAAPEANATDDAPEGDTEGTTPEAEDKAADAESSEDSDEAEGAPEEYADFEAPEGVTFDTELLDQLKGLAKEDNLSQAKAQKYIDLAVQMQTRQAEAFDALVVDTRQAWLDQSRSDPEFGGDALDANLATVQRALKAYATPELTKLLDETGIGNHPEVVRLLFRVGKSVSNDGFVKGSPPPAKRDLASTLYSNNSTTKE